jgi:hypothetical protein
MKKRPLRNDHSLPEKRGRLFDSGPDEARDARPEYTRNADKDGLKIVSFIAGV